MHLLRYEDLVNTPLEAFTKLVEMLGINFNEQNIIDAINMCSFINLKMQEKERGFDEFKRDIGSFFRKGRSDAWKEELKQKEIDRIVNENKFMMKKFSYL